MKPTSFLLLNVFWKPLRREKIQFIWKKKYLIIILVQTKSFKQNQILGLIERQMHKLIVQKNLN